MARRKKHEEHENHERWLVSYADFITLLFAFFTVLYATSQKDAAKEKEFEESIRQKFAGLMAVVHMAGTNGGEAVKTSLAEITESLNNFPSKSAGPAEIQQYVERVLQKNVSQSDYQKSIEGIRHDSVGVHIQLAASVIFQTGSANLEEEGLATLEKVARLLKSSKRRLIVEGHTDDQTIQSTRFASNWELGAMRATKIVRYLISRGVDPALLTAVTYADQKPLVENSSEENRAKNRRIEILITQE